jgi:HK97 family phage major capsid protein
MASKLDDLEQDRISTKSFEGWFNRAEAEAEQLKAGIKAYNHAQSYRGGADLNGGDGYTAPSDVRCKGRAPALVFPDADYRQAWDAHQRHQGFTIGTKDFASQVVTKARGDTGPGAPSGLGSVSDLAYNAGAGSGISAMLPPELHPVITAQIHEQRLLDHLPVIGMHAPSYEFIRHVSTTGAPAVVAEGAVKPDVQLVLDTLILQAVKLAATSGVTYETWIDYDRFLAYLTTELPREIVDKENNALIYGPGGAGQIEGLFNVPGILTHTASGTNNFDDLEEGIAALRVGPSLAVCDLMAFHPSTWSAIRREKDNYGRYLVSPDPSKDEVNSAWGVEVISSTALNPGDGLLLDTTKFGAGLVREGMTIRTGQNNDDFSRNIVRYAFEERINLACERPTAVLKMSGLPTSIGGS